MGRHEEIKNAYKSLGGEATFYDGMVTCSTLLGKAVCKLVWNMDKRKNDRYLQLALSGIPKGFSGRMLEVPVGTGVLTMPVYETLGGADITCLDYSPDMMGVGPVYVAAIITITVIAVIAGRSTALEKGWDVADINTSDLRDMEGFMTQETLASHRQSTMRIADQVYSVESLSETGRRIS